MSTTVSFVNVSKVYRHLDLTNDEIHRIEQDAFYGVSYGDAFATLVGNNFALSCILEGYGNGRLTKEEMSTKFWEVVGKDDYINLES